MTFTCHMGARWSPLPGGVCPYSTRKASWPPTSTPGVHSLSSMCHTCYRWVTACVHTYVHTVHVHTYMCIDIILCMYFI